MRRENKRADFMIFTIKDQITRVVIEAKLNISDTLNYAMKSDFAQLFLEAMYADKQEGGQQEKMLCALTDGMTCTNVHVHVTHTLVKCVTCELIGVYVSTSCAPCKFLLESPPI